MTNPSSPEKHNGYSDDPLFAQAKFTQEISQRMRVPKRIKATGEYSEDDHLLLNHNGTMNSWNYHDKIDMNVPDRIVVIGQEQHLGTRSAPREIVLENAVLPKDPGFIRVATPPRMITLNEHHFPDATDEDEEYIGAVAGSPPYLVRASATAQPILGFVSSKDLQSPADDSISERQTPGSIANRKALNFSDNQLVSLGREGTPPMGEFLNPSEEVMHMRRQLAKLNRRVLSIEIDNVQRQQREKIIYCLGLAYFLLKAIYWLNRN